MSDSQQSINPIDFMDHFRFYRVTKQYTDFLKTVCGPSVNIKHNGQDHDSAFVGIVLYINSKFFFAPLTSDKRNRINTRWHQKEIITTNADGSNRKKYGAVLLHDMIPVPLTEVSLIDFEKLKLIRPKYYNVIFNEYQWINIPSNSDEIRYMANEVYRVSKDSNDSQYRYLRYILKCDIEKLENAYDLFVKQKIIRK